MAARTWPHRTLRTAPRQTRRSPLNPATRSAADRTGVRAPTPIRCVQSRCPLASPAACASPLPCAHVRNTRLWIAQFISYRYPDLHHRLVAMQSTGVYWIAVYDILEEAGLEVYLVNARETRNLPGRKSDVQESQWLMKLHTYGLLRNSFRPSQEIRTMRTYWRQRNDLVRAAGRQIQRMQKTLTQMNIQLANVLSDISGMSGQAIIRAVLEGERDPHGLAALCNLAGESEPGGVYKCIECFDHHFCNQNLSVVLPGGEPLIDKRNMGVLLKHLTTCDYVVQS